MQRIALLFALFATLLPAHPTRCAGSGGDEASGRTRRAGGPVQIVWEASSQQFVGPGVYARVKKLADGDLGLVYSDGPAVWFRRSSDGGRTWNAPCKVAEAEPYHYTNAELLPLQNGELLYLWNARPRREGVHPYLIMSARSRDGGRTWSDEQIRYAAGVRFTDGCWEPAALQLPDGEIQLYFANEGPYTASDEQEITLLRSRDNGVSWSEPQTIAFRAGSRDGMPVPIALREGSEIVVAIEDNGIAGRFKPVTVRTVNNWQEGVVGGGSPARRHALAAAWQLPDSVYAGAPYLIRLTNGATLLSVQSTAGRSGTNERFANMQVYAGDAHACGFGEPTMPFAALPPQAQALWNALCQVDETTVLAVSSIGGLPQQNGIWIVRGRIVAAE